MPKWPQYSLSFITDRTYISIQNDKMAKKEQDLKEEVQIKFRDELYNKIKSEVDETYNKIKAEVDESKEAYFTLQLQNEELNREIDHQHILNTHYTSKTKNQINCLKDALETLSNGASDIIGDLDVSRKEERLALHHRYDTLAKLPNHLVFQSNEIISQELEEITSKVSTVAAALYRESQSFDALKESEERWLSDIQMFFKDDHHFQSFIYEQKRINICLELSKNR